MAKQRDEALRTTSEKEPLLAKVVNQKNQLNAAHLQWASKITANFSKLQAKIEILKIRCVEADDTDMALVDPAMLNEVKLEIPQELQQSLNS